MMTTSQIRACIAFIDRLRRWKHAPSFAERCKPTPAALPAALKGRSLEARQTISVTGLVTKVTTRERPGSAAAPTARRRVWRRRSFKVCAPCRHQSYPNFRVSHMPAADTQLSPPGPALLRWGRFFEQARHVYVNSAWRVGPKVDFRKTTGIVYLILKVTSMTYV
jgi:hypothetical protein